MLADAETSHRSWFGRGRTRVELGSVTLYLGPRNAFLAFPRGLDDLERAVRAAREAGVHEVSCWALAPDDALGATLARLGFQDGWQPHWMGVDPRGQVERPAHDVEQTAECSPHLPYAHAGEETVIGGDVHHLVIRGGDAIAGGAIAGHGILDVAGHCGGIYDMAVAPGSRRRGYGRALVLAALALARTEGCHSVTLNATGEGEPLYRSVGFTSLGRGMTWWLFP
jgi:GNAT superfamily N-acetyltransferase